MRRRDVLGLAAGLAGGALLGCSFRRDTHAGETGLASLLATVRHDRLLLKASFHARLDAPPRLLGAGRPTAGRCTDGAGRFWSFDADGLEPARGYTLELRAADDTLLHGPWDLRTFPAPDAHPERLRLLIFSCAGGHDALRDFLSPRLPPVFQSIEVRTRLLERGLAFEPDALIANGDHVYWDLRSRTSLGLGRSPFAWWAAGRFDRERSVLGTRNERVLRLAAGPQIADLYGTRCASVPVFFLRDDHDYFENDEATEALRTFPPDAFMRRLARATQHLYYPEFLPDPVRPVDLPGASAPDRPHGVSESFGTLRYGRLLEALLYDCCGFVSLGGAEARFVPAPVERWLLGRIAQSDADHVVQVPSTPPGWSAGKWLEWYPDVFDEEAGRLVTSRPKFGWQSGWQAQHDRLLAAAVGRQDRLPLVLGGDLHCIAAGRITRSGARDWTANPVLSVLPGTLGTAGRGWPSAIRGIGATPPDALEVEEIIPPIEENGFVIADFTPAEVALRFFRWHPDQGVEAIPELEPFERLRFVRSPGAWRQR